MPQPNRGAKKYLLYIYNPEFSKLTKRGEKSGLVNKLVDEYFKRLKKGL